MTARIIYQTPIHPDWIDYNQHLNDAYYIVAMSRACDTFMTLVGIDEHYRTTTSCTLYSLEAHAHWLREVKFGETLCIGAHVLGADAKRVHLGFEVRVEGKDGLAATGEFMLLHYRQGDNAGAAPFPESIRAAIDGFNGPEAGEWEGPRSRALGLVKRS
jgi:acyl-CoA thioester hydrolase